MSIYNNAVKKHFDKFAPKREYYQQLNHYYHQSLRELCAFFIPKSSVVLQLGSGTGDLLAYLRPKKGFGIDISGAMIKIAQKKHPALQFKQGDVQTSTFNSKFEYIILTDLIGHLGDVQKTFENIT
jgi:ubiquinone/menaquinone biosynthesis C-methylase UbiE